MTTIGNVQDLFGDLNDAQKKDNLAIVDYLNQLASQTKTNISRWDIAKAFGGPNGGLILDKTEINKVFFTKKEQLDKRKKEEVATLDDVPDLNELIEKNVNSVIKTRIANLEGSLDSYRSEARRHQERAQKNLESLVTARLELEKLQGKDPVAQIRTEINETLAEGFWINPVVKDRFLYLNTKENIVLRHENKRAGVETQLDLGQFAVKINLTNFGLKVIPYKNNIQYSTEERELEEIVGSYHPHVDTGGGQCWGTARDQHARWVEGLNLGKILKLLAALLYEFNDADAYVQLGEMEKHHVKLKTIRHPLSLVHPENMPKPREPNYNSGETIINIFRDE